MKKSKKIALCLAVAFNLFLAIFALDVFSEGYGFIETIIALTMHLLPNIILGLITFLAYKRTVLGGLVFLFLGVIFTLFFKTYQDIITFLIVSAPLFLIGLLLLSPMIKKENRKSKSLDK